jgi:hypothetical protein
LTVEPQISAPAIPLPLTEPPSVPPTTARAPPGLIVIVPLTEPPASTHVLALTVSGPLTVAVIVWEHVTVGDEFAPEPM